MNRPYYRKSKNDNHNSGRSGFNGGYRNSQPRPQFQNKKQMGSFNPSHLVSEAKDLVPEEAFIPKNEFKDFNLDPRLFENITRKNYTTPTPIQDQAIPAMLEGRDVIGIANTGTGKTAAFLIPLINKLLFDKTKKVIILAPTRELAVQIRDEFEEFTRGLNLYSVLLIGGVNSYRQKQDLRREFHVVPNC